MDVLNSAESAPLQQQEQMLNPKENQCNEFLEVATKLKTEVRHSWPLGKENGRRESVADHSWSLVLMVMLYADKIDKPVNITRCMQMAAIHDLPEAITGDIPVIVQDKEVKAQKDILERKAYYEMTANLPVSTKDSMRELYESYEAQDTYEAKFVKALDKIEAFAQHNRDPLDTWEEKEKDMLFQHRYLMRHCEFDSFLKSLAQNVIEQGIKKLIAAGEDINAIKQRASELDKFNTL